MPTMSTIERNMDPDTNISTHNNVANIEKLGLQIFRGSNSAVMIYGIGSKPMQLKNNTAAKQIGGIHSNPGCLLQKNPYKTNIA